MVLNQLFFPKAVSRGYDFGSDFIDLFYADQIWAGNNSFYVSRARLCVLKLGRVRQGVKFSPRRMSIRGLT